MQDPTDTNRDPASVIDAGGNFDALGADVAAHIAEKASHEGIAKIEPEESEKPKTPRVSTTPLVQSSRLVLARYLLAWPGDVGHLQALIAQLMQPADVCDRLNMQGHITVSALVLNPTLTRFLRIYHPTFDRWLLPGGHVERDSLSLWLSAVDEVMQETGVVGLDAVGTANGLTIPFHIDTHAIAANPAKGETEHSHHDFLFLAVAGFESEPEPLATDTVKVAQWVPVGELRDLGGDRYRTVHARLDGLLQQT